MGNFSSQITLIIEENNGITPNEIFEASKLYLGTIVSSKGQSREIKEVKMRKSLIHLKEWNSFGN